ncbi:MAG: hypothetical protein V5A76_07025 [Candidatus Thermoplasmatota archaeon]
MMGKNKTVTFASVFLLIFSAVLFSGCTDEQEGEVGIPSEGDLEWDYHQEENQVEITIPIWNRYDEPKDIVIEFIVMTEDENQVEKRHSKIEKLRLPENSEEKYTRSVDIPENETPTSVEGLILVWEDEVGTVKVSGEYLEGVAKVNATIGNTNPEQKNITVRFEVQTGEDVYKDVKRFNLPGSSINEYQKEVDDIPEGENPVDYRAEIIRKNN